MSSEPMQYIYMCRLIHRLDQCNTEYTRRFIEQQLEHHSSTNLSQIYESKLLEIKTAEINHLTSPSTASSPIEQHVILESTETSTSQKPQPSTNVLLKAPLIRKRKPMVKEAATAAHNSPTALAQESKKQEEISQDLLELTSKLKSNALMFQDRLSRDKTVVDSTHGLLDSNVNRIKSLGQRLKETNIRNNGLFWFSCFGIAFVIFAFMFMFFVIKIF